MLTDRPEWKALSAHYTDIKDLHIRDLFTQNPQRGEAFLIELNGMLLDYSKNPITTQTMEKLHAYARSCGLEEKREDMFSGAKINHTENRAVLHTALRAPKDSTIKVDGENIVPYIHDGLAHMQEFSKKIRGGALTGYTGKHFTHIINIGIGGSDLGPKMAYEALANSNKSNISVRFVSNVDPADISEALQCADPETTLFIIASKTFTTQETMANAHAARAWFLKSASNDAHLEKHFIALSTNIDAVKSFGIAEDNIFPFKEWVGGRFSVWSSIGLSISLAYGFDTFRAFLDGAHEMDEHFRTAPLEKNMPVTLALLGLWYRNFCDYGTYAVLPYYQRLNSFARWLQQLDMESNGKSIDNEGHKTTYNTAPIIFGEPGTNGQHAFYQLLHQGTSIVPCDFIGVIKDEYEIGDQHTMLLANLLAQSKAMMEGKPIPEAGKPYKNFEGNRPNNMILLDKLDARTLGKLMALYEHKIFVQGILWNINSFDQWGVELGKILSKEIMNDLQSPQTESNDASCRTLLRHIHKKLASS